MIVGCNLDVSGVAGIPQGSVVVMTDADWAGETKTVAAFLELQFWVNDSVENTLYPVYASSKKQNMVFTVLENRLATKNDWRKL